MDDKSFQTQLSNTDIVAELKKASLLKKEGEKLKAYSKGFEDLGDWYVGESDLNNQDILKKHRMRLKAVCLYNLALASGGDQHTLVSKIQLIDEGILRAAGSQASSRSENEYFQEIQEYKQNLTIIRDTAKQHLAQIDIASIEVKTIYQNIAIGLKKLITTMIEKCFELLPPPNDCQYTIVVLGSLAREEATPYSDLEWAILIGDDNKQHKVYFRCLTELVWIKILNLQETTPRMMDIQELEWFFETDSPCRKGFSFDGQMISGCHTPLGNCHHTASKIKAIEQSNLLTTEEKATQIRKIKDGEYELIGTPEELADCQAERWGTKRGFCTVLSTVASIISNSDDLLSAYEENMAAIWKSPLESNPNQTIIQQRSLTYLAESVERFQFKGGYFDKETHYFDAKYHLYRLPNMLIDHVSSFYGVQSKNLWGRIDRIFGEEGVVQFPEKSQALKRVISQVLGLRLQAYLKKGYRDDHIVMFDLQNPEKNEDAVIKYLGVNETLLLQIYSELIELQWRIESFIEEQGDIAALVWNYGDMSDVTQGEWYQLLLNYPKAAAAYENAKQKMTDTSLSNQFHLAEILNNLGLVYKEQGQYPEAIKMLKDSKRIRIKIYGRNHISVANVFNNLGAVYDAQTQYDAAIAAYKKAKEIISNLPSPSPLSVANVWNNLGSVYEAQASNDKTMYAEAFAAYDEAKRIRINFYAPDHLSVAGTLNNLANVFAAQNQYPEAFAAHEKARQIKIATYGPEHPSVAETLNNLGAMYAAQGNDAEAILVYEDAKRILITIYGPDDLLVGQVQNNLGAIYQSLFRYGSAVAAYEDAKRILESILGHQHAFVGGVHQNLGRVYYAQARYDQSHMVYKEAKRISLANADDTSVAEIMNDIGDVYTAQARYSKAIRAYQKAINIMLANPNPDHLAIAEVQCNIGLVMIEQKQYEEARSFFDKALEVYESADHPNQENAKANIVVSYIREGNACMLQKEMNVEHASSCYQHALLSRAPDDPELHQDKAKQFYDTNQFTAALEHYRIFILLSPPNASTLHNLACLIHYLACIEQNKGETKQALEYIKEAEVYFERAIQLTTREGVCTDSGVCTEYANFLWKNRAHYDSQKIIALLLHTITVKQTDIKLCYGLMERFTLDQYIQSLLDQENKLSFKAYYLAHYLLINVYCATNQLQEAQALCRDFRVQVIEDNETYEFTQLALRAQFSDLIEADPDDTKHYEEQLRQQSLANEKQQRLHAKLVEGSEAAIERCIASQLNESKQSTHSPSLSPRLLRDSPILSGEAAKERISIDEKSEVSQNSIL